MYSIVLSCLHCSCNLKDHGGDSLIQAGHICLCEKHANIISDQKTAISQLRQRLNELELAKPPGI